MPKFLSTLASQATGRSSSLSAPTALLQDPLDQSIEEVDKDLNDAARAHTVKSLWGVTKRNDGNRAFSEYLKEWKETLNEARLGEIPFDDGSTDRPSISNSLQLHRCQLRDMETYSNDIGRPDSQFTKGHEAKVRKYCSQVLRVVAGVPTSTVISEQDAIDFVTLGNRSHHVKVLTPSDVSRHYQILQSVRGSQPTVGTAASRKAEQSDNASMPQSCPSCTRTRSTANTGPA